MGCKVPWMKTVNLWCQASGYPQGQEAGTKELGGASGVLEMLIFWPGG